MDLGRAHLTEVSMSCFREEGEGQKVLPAPVVAQIPSAYIIQYATVPCFAVACPKPHQWSSMEENRQRITERKS